MKWEEVRQLYPHQWLKIKVLASHIEGDRKVIDDMEVIETIPTDLEAGRALGKCKGNIAVYHTYHQNIYYKIKNIFGFRAAR